MFYSKIRTIFTILKSDIMEDIIKKAICNCSIRYSENESLGLQLWDDNLTPFQKAEDIATQLRKSGYTIVLTKLK